MPEEWNKHFRQDTYPDSEAFKSTLKIGLHFSTVPSLDVLAKTRINKSIYVFH